MLPFSDRAEAGRLLASKLATYAGKPDVVLVALPRGGVPVAFEIAQRLHAPLDVLVVRKLGVPWQPELAMGAVASGGVRMLDQALIRSLNLSNHVIEHLIGKEEKEIERREALFRDGYPAQDLSGRTVILVDDGAATGATMLAAAETVRMQHAKEVVIAIPVASHMACSAFKSEAAKCIYLATPEPFYAVGRSYESFPQVGDEEVQALLSRARFHSSGIESPIRSSPTS